MFRCTSFSLLCGLAKWPIYPWYKKRQNRKKREAKETSLVTEEPLLFEYYCSDSRQP